MNRYLKDPIILLCSISWVIALLVFVVQMSTGATPQASHAAQVASAPPAAVSASAISNNLAPQSPTGTGGNNPTQAGTLTSGTQTTPAVLPALVLSPIIRHISGQITVGKSSAADTIDLDAALKQRHPEEKIFLEAGIFPVDELPSGTTPEHLIVKGIGEQSVIKLHSSGFGVVGNSRFEDLSIVGPAGTSTFWVQNNGILTLKNVLLKESSFGVSVANSGKLYADNLRTERIDSFCVALSNSARAEISGSNFTDCFTAINIQNLAKADIHSSNFRSNTFAFDIKDDRNHATCTSCGFESVQNKVNIENRLTLTERNLDKTTTSRTAESSSGDVTVFKGESSGAKASN
jgi:hypothetical protein